MTNHQITSATMINTAAKLLARCGVLAALLMSTPAFTQNTMATNDPSSQNPSDLQHAAANLPANAVVLEDFKRMADTSPQDRWEFIADTVMGGVSSGTVQFVPDNDQPDNAHIVLKLTGSVSTANNGGFIQARLPLDQTTTPTLPDTAKGIWLIARGNGQKYFVHVRTSGTILPWQYYQAAFEVTSDWQVIELPWESFKPSGGLSGSLLRDEPKSEKIKSIAIVAFGRDHEADVEVAQIGYY